MLRIHFSRLRRSRLRRSNERGQTSLFMALFIFTMITMFAFTTNVGMLVHAKINLQNAADAAAYAGAAVQARQLTAAAYINWEMRRALKEFLFYYDVRSQYAAMPCFPNDAYGQPRVGIGCPPNQPFERHDFRFFDPRENTNENGNNYLPSVCIIFDAKNNYCQKAAVAGIPEFQGGGSWGVADPIVAAVKNATNQIIDKKINDCLGRTEINAQFLISWLFNLNPVQGADALLTIGRDSDDPFPYSDGLERVGVLPRMSILRSRIDNFEEALNLNLANEGVGSVTVTQDTMGTLRGAASGGGKTLDYFERPIQAYLSAKNNLPGIGGDNGIFGNVEMTELIPNQAGAPASGAGFDNTFIKNPPVLVKFKDEFAHVNFAFSKFATVTGGALERGNCYQYRSVNAIPHFPFGVSKYPGLLTYYAVRLQAKARLLFSPFGGNGIVTLSAYSAAKPFGSRVGIDISPDAQGEMEKHRMVADARAGDGDVYYGTFKGYRFPNVTITDDPNSDSQANGFSQNAHLGYLRGAMFAIENGLPEGPRLAGAYAPWEVGYFTIPAQYNAPESVGLFEDNPRYGDNGRGQFFTMAAPILPVNGGEGLGFLRLRVEEWLYGQAGPEDAPSAEGKYADSIGIFLSDAKWAILFNYLNLRNETTNIYIPDPTLSDDPALLSYARTYGQRFTVAATDNYQRRQFTSWNNQKTSGDQDLGGGTNIPANSELGPDIGRSGYSVKFVSFRSLIQGGRGTNDPLMPDMQWSNPFPRFNAGGGQARIESDLNQIRH